MSAPSRVTIALVGMRCAGKSVVGKALAQRLGLPFLDLDEALLVDARHAGVKASMAGELLAKVGQLEFRKFESSALRRVLETGQELVLATGGGSLERASNRGWLKRAARCVWLRADLSTLAQRMQQDPGLRPSLTGADPMHELGALLERRSEAYGSLSEFSLDCTHDEPAELAQEIERRLG